MLVALPSRRLGAAILLAFLVIFSLTLLSPREKLHNFLQQKLELESKPEPPSSPTPPHPKYKPTPTYTPPPVKDNFPLLATSTPPPIPEWNRPRKDAYKDYNLPVPPPLLIGFTRTWPVLLQAVVSYITAGWPPEQIYVVENTGVQQANARGQLSLQNPLYLNHTVLKTLGVNIVQTPTLLNFAQMQNFFLSLTYANNWPYFFWSHMDVLALSFEDGFDDLTPRYNQPGYKTLYELALTTLAETRSSDPRWATRFFAYDHLAAVNPAAYEDVGGWDTLIPYYMTDCDMHSRLLMRNWTMRDAKAGIITDVASALEDLSVLYRVDGFEPAFVDPNPPPPPPPPNNSNKNERDLQTTAASQRRRSSAQNCPNLAPRDDPNLAKWHALRIMSDKMFQHKHGDRDRNTWQLGQRGGHGEPFYYPAAGLAEGIDVLTEAGREVYRRKWGHRNCDLISGAGLSFEDAWLVEKDWD
ncbi:hypothetical protein N656DRAFT_719132 [Canariomyces notabilis]|uniref:Uncharacterized protein n=1 Tax=Canariomyces notabilis TaxID=2074819 RepID=A0AAN6T7T8_9PEZI|nr:hypothetical protein N656DRAFT_719132 [Canariomyces arenarius]